MDDIENYIDQFERGVCLSKFYNKTTHEVVTINDTSFKYPSIEDGSINPSSVYSNIWYFIYCNNYMILYWLSKKKRAKGCI